jgi:hypothetical protein
MDAVYLSCIFSLNPAFFRRTIRQVSQTTECPGPDGKLAGPAAEIKPQPQLLVDAFALTGA